MKKLLVLESEHGPLPGYQPAVSEVVDYLNAVNYAQLIIELVHHACI